MNVSLTPGHTIGSIHYYGRFGGAFCAPFVVVSVDDRSAHLAEVVEVSVRDADGYFTTAFAAKVSA